MHLKIGRLLAMIVHCMVQFIVDSCKSCGPDILKIMFIIIKRRLKSERKILTYNNYEIWSTTCYHSPLHGTIQFGALQKLCVRHGP